MSIDSISLPGKDHTMPVVLVVDDDEDSRFMLKTLLEMWNYRVLEAGDGEEAVRLVERTRLDLILMDIIMPELDGFDAARRIRQSAQNSDTPIVFLSGCAEKDYRQAASDVGASEYLVKPVHFDELEKTLGKFISRSQQIAPDFPAGDGGYSF